MLELREFDCRAGKEEIVGASVFTKSVIYIFNFVHKYIV